MRGKQKRYLRSLANTLKPIFQVGKYGVNQNLITQVDEALEKRELIKISILQNCSEDKEEVASELAQATNSFVVQIIGNTIILYKESIEHKSIQLPN